MNAVNPPGSGASPGSTADPGVRVAWAADAHAIAEVQVRAWRRAYADILPAPVLDGLEPETIGPRWHDSLTRPGDARNRVVVAVVPSESGEIIVGFAVLAPSDDPDADPIVDGEIAEFVIDPEHIHQGHGSRLLQAGVDTLRADGFERAVIWLLTTDDELRKFMTTAGWVPDGAHREVELHGYESVRLKQVRLHCGIAE